MGWLPVHPATMAIIEKTAPPIFLSGIFWWPLCLLCLRLEWCRLLLLLLLLFSPLLLREPVNTSQDRIRPERIEMFAKMVCSNRQPNVIDMRREVKVPSSSVTLRSTNPLMIKTVAVSFSYSYYSYYSLEPFEKNFRTDSTPSAR